MSNDRKVYESDTADYAFCFKQKKWSWTACLGNCGNGNGFTGGIREVVLLGKFIPLERTDNLKNYQLSWNTNSLIYHRFDENTFDFDQVWGDRATFVNGSSSSMMVKELQPQDICPFSLDSIDMLEIGHGFRRLLDPVKIFNVNFWEFTNKPKQYFYGYAMSMKVMFTEHWCHV